jgi:hypothetical protein
MRTGTRWGFPSAFLPHVGVSVPAVVAPDPYMLVAWCGATRLHHNSRWCNSHYNFGSLGGPNSEGGREQSGQE